MLNNFPRNPDGTFQRFPDPFQPWARYQNDGGVRVLGRSNNCADCTRSFIESWYGNPQVSAVRTYDRDANGDLDRNSGERDGTNNIQNWAGTAFRASGSNAHDGYARIADELRQAGHGAVSAVLVTWPTRPNGTGGGAHVFNAVNHNGRVIWVDSQSGEVSHQPLGTNAVGVWHLTLDANRNPYDPTRSQVPLTPQQPPHTYQPSPYQQPQPTPYTRQPGPYQQPHHPAPYAQQPHQPGPYAQPRPYQQPQQPGPDAQPGPYQQPQQPPQQQNPHVQQQPRPYTEQQPYQRQTPQNQPYQQQPQPQPGPNQQNQQPDSYAHSQQHPNRQESLTQEQTPTQRQASHQDHVAQESFEPAPDHGDSDPDPNSLHAIRADLDQETGGLRAPDPADQQRLEDAHPRNPDGTPQRFANPFDPWSRLQNDGGDTVPGRGNNCADCSRSFLETWYGNPQVSAPRTLDADEHGNVLAWKPEDNSNENQIRWSGATHTYAGRGDDPRTAARIAHDLQQAGHGAAAIVQVNWPNGRGGHAFNAVNYHGRIIWVDAQSGVVSTDPLHIPKAEHAFYIPLDANRRPLHADHVMEKPDRARTDTSENKPDATTESTDAEISSHDVPTDKVDDSNESSTGRGTAESWYMHGDERTSRPLLSRERLPAHRGADISRHLAEVLRNDPQPLRYGRPVERPSDGEVTTRDSQTRTPPPGAPRWMGSRSPGTAEPAGAEHEAAHRKDENHPPPEPSGGESDPTGGDHDLARGDDSESRRDEDQDPAVRFKVPSAGDVRVDDPPEFPDPVDPGDAPDTRDLDSEVENKRRGGFVEQLDLNDTGRVELDDNGLITSVDGKTVREYVQEMSEERARRHAEMRDADDGPCSALAIDRRTGLITEGLNGDPDDAIRLKHLHPLLRKNYLGMAAWMHPIMASEGSVLIGNRIAPDGSAARDENGKVIPNSEMVYTGRAYFDDPLRHAEVKAVNELLWARQRKHEEDWRKEHGEDSTPPPLSREVLDEMRFDPRWIETAVVKRGKNKGNIIHSVGESAPACPNCNGVLQGVPSYAGRHQYSIGDYRRRDKGNYIPPVME
ncbi:toxin glutamine deamidase domain-containing protein [Streptomyces sp. NPDC018019]|uniref:toxin glutamine deamidase domain-containing protein n=1 Tax=Streptomyces sp. NPDC018019 TaxID=3365030 RepID=UPI0037BBFA96